MNYKKSLGTVSAALMIIIALTLVLPPGAGAQVKYKTLYSFKGGSDGAFPTASLIFDTAGNLYGTAAGGGDVACGPGYGCGVVFKLSRNTQGTWTKTVIYSFTGGTDGAYPHASLIFDTAGNLYGTTIRGGSPNCYAGCGTVFKLAPNSNGSWTESVLYSFTGGSDGTYPYASLIFDTAGNLYGTTEAGGNTQYSGTVFKLSPNSSGGWTESVLFSPSSNNFGDGWELFGSLLFDAAGNLYGTTWEGGVRHCGCGTVFKLAPNSDGDWTHSVLHSFGVKHGAYPYAGLIFDSAGSLYSTTSGGGTSRAGVVFKLSPNTNGSWTEVVLHNFTGGKDGRQPWDGMIFDGAGNLYGTTREGGAYGYGVVFELAHKLTSGWTYRVLHAFRDNPGGATYAGLTIDASGNLYGTTPGDGRTTFGSVFEITP